MNDIFYVIDCIVLTATGAVILLCLKHLVSEVYAGIKSACQHREAVKYFFSRYKSGEQYDTRLEYRLNRMDKDIREVFEVIKMLKDGNVQITDVMGKHMEGCTLNFDALADGQQNMDARLQALEVKYAKYLEAEYAKEYKAGKKKGNR